MATFKKSYNSNKSDTVLINGKIVTVDKLFRVQQAVAIKNEKIVCVGTYEQTNDLVRKNTQIFNLEGKTVLPGINDTHNHAKLFVNEMVTRKIT